MSRLNILQDCYSMLLLTNHWAGRAGLVIFLIVKETRGSLVTLAVKCIQLADWDSDSQENNENQNSSSVSDCEMDQIIRRPDCALYIATKQKHRDIQSVSQSVS